jgi:hypothetical protein
LTREFDATMDITAAQEDVNMVFFVNIPLQLEGEALRAQQELASSIQSWQAFASFLCERAVMQQVGDVYYDDTKGQFARASFRSKEMDRHFRQSPW